jgi:hypothetical protein
MNPKIDEGPVAVARFSGLQAKGADIE